MIRILSSSDAAGLLTRKAARLAEAEAVVQPILDAVRQRGDDALLEYAKKFDGLPGDSVRVPAADLSAARKSLSGELIAAAQYSIANIREYAERQMPKPWTMATSAGTLGQIIRPLGTVAAYIPGGRYPLPSTLLMTVVPAQVARVPEICVACPQPAAAVWGAAELLGVKNVFRMGGAQAIAAFAFGTESVPRADRIVGPGNIYVAAAKKLLAGEVGIDFIAGPTEILIIAEEGDAVHLAADMLAQAEHDADASAVLLTTSRALAANVAAEISSQLADLSTAPVARQSIDNNSAIIVVETLPQAFEISNRFAPEHLSIPRAELLDSVENAGSVFIGPFSPEAAGDYASGPNHVLPTNGAARIRGGLSVHDFLKIISVQELSGTGLRHLAPAVAALARAEGLEAHARSVEVRLG